MILTGFQFRAARHALNLTFTQLHKNTGILRGVLTRLENTIPNLEEIKCSAQDAEILLNYFNNNKLIFPDQNTIVLDMDIEPKPIENNLTRFQFIVARTALKLTQDKLSNAINITKSVISEYDKKLNTEYIISRYLYLDSIIKFFIERDLLFLSNLSVKISTNNKKIV